MVVPLKILKMPAGKCRVTQKMHHKDFKLKSVLEVGFYFSACVLDSEFRA